MALKGGERGNLSRGGEENGCDIVKQLTKLSPLTNDSFSGFDWEVVLHETKVEEKPTAKTMIPPTTTARE